MTGSPDEFGRRFERAVRAQLRAEIAAAGKKQNEVAREAGLQSSTLSRWLSDPEDRSFPVAATAAIAQVLGIPLSELMRRAQLRMDGAAGTL